MFIWHWLETPKIRNCREVTCLSDFSILLYLILRRKCLRVIQKSCGASQIVFSGAVNSNTRTECRTARRISLANAARRLRKRDTESFVTNNCFKRHDSSWRLTHSPFQYEDSKNMYTPEDCSEYLKKKPKKERRKKNSKIENWQLSVSFDLPR